MISTIQTIITKLTAGLTTGHSESDDYYVKTYYTGDPLAMNSFETPSCAVIPGRPSSRKSEFVGEDTVQETIFIRFYQMAMRKGGEVAETSAAYSRLNAMHEKAQAIVRTDPTFGSTFVNSEIISVDPLLHGIPDSNVYRIAEIQIEITRRALWGLLVS